MTIETPLAPKGREVLRRLLIKDIVISDNIRKFLDEESLELLAQSLIEFGQAQPILVNQVEGVSHLIDGYRRVMAALRAGLTEITARVREGAVGGPVRSLEQLVLNCQRENLSDVEMARALHELKTATGMTSKQLAARAGLSESKVSRLLELLELAPWLLAKVESRQLPASVALEIHQRPATEQADACARYLQGGMTRDDLAGKRKLQKNSHGTAFKKTTRVTAVFAEERSVSVAAPDLDFDVYISVLEEALMQAKRMRTRGLTLSTYAKYSRDTAHAKLETTT